MCQAERHLAVSASTQSSRARLGHYKHKSRASNWKTDAELEKNPTPFFERNMETVLSIGNTATLRSMASCCQKW